MLSLLTTPIKFLSPWHHGLRRLVRLPVSPTMMLSTGLGPLQSPLRLSLLGTGRFVLGLGLSLPKVYLTYLSISQGNFGLFSNLR